VKLLAFEFTKRQVEQLGILIRNSARLPMAAMHSANNKRTKFLNLRLLSADRTRAREIVNEYKELVETINDLRDILPKSRCLHHHQKRTARNPRQVRLPSPDGNCSDEAEINIEDLIVNEGASSASRTPALSSAPP